MKQKRFTSLIAGTALAATVFLSACGDDKPVEPVQVTVTASDSVAPSPAEEPSPSQEMTPSEMPSPTDEMSPTDAQSPTDTTSPGGDVSGTVSLTPAGKQYFTTFCTGITEWQDAVKDLQGSPNQSIDQVKPLVVKAYDEMGSTLSKTGQTLGTLDHNLGFEGDQEWAAENVKMLNDVGQIYTEGSKQVSAASIKTEADLTTEIKQIEEKAAAANPGQKLGVDKLSPEVSAAVQESVPACGQ